MVDKDASEEISNHTLWSVLNANDSGKMKKADQIIKFGRLCFEFGDPTGTVEVELSIPKSTFGMAILNIQPIMS